jgi:hypothetical protein
MLTELPLDVADLEAARIVSTYNDSIDVLVNNTAALSPSDGVLGDVDFGQVMQAIDVNRLWSFVGRLTVSAVAPRRTSEADCQHLVRSREDSRLRTNRLVWLRHVEDRFEHAVAACQLPCSAGLQSSSRVHWRDGG